MSFEDEFRNPPREFSLLPFWFWNDALDRNEILRQIEAFERNGVYGFVIHPRVGLPRDLGWMSDKLLGFYHIAIEEAARRGMKVLLYDEGMYPSGSSSGQVVQRWPELACRCLAIHEADAPLPSNAIIVDAITGDDGRRMRVVDRPADSVIRGLHYIGEGPAEDEPPAGDILNPRTADAVIELVYARFFKEFGAHFGKTILGIFTDEPSALGRCREKGVMPGTTGILDEVSRLLGYDFRPHLPALWSTKAESEQYRRDYLRAIRTRLEETWYRPLSEWCERHTIALCGHPDAGDEIGAQRFFQIPGQDLVWRWVAPDKPSAAEGPEATQGKCTSSAMIHAHRRRNSNEFAGAYGAETTFDEIRWLANWCLIRGVNMLIPHAFYYSVRGLRRDERPPQIGLHTPQWDREFKAFADHCRRISWLNADSRHLCHVAILTEDDRCPWRAAAEILKGQRDFNYLDPHTLLHAAKVDASGVDVGPMRYELIVIDSDLPLRKEIADALRPMIERSAVTRLSSRPCEDGVPRVNSAQELIARMDAAHPPMLRCACADDALRVRTVEKAGQVIHMLFNESASRTIEVNLPDADALVLESSTDACSPMDSGSILHLRPCDLIVLRRK